MRGRFDTWLALVRSFHTFEPGHIGDEHLEAGDLAAWSGKIQYYGGTGAQHAADFLLMVWFGRGKFDMASAWAHWDNEMKAAWKAWAREPWFA